MISEPNETAVLLFYLLAFLVSCSPEKKAKTNFLTGKYQKVIDYYQSVLTKQPNNPKANYFVAESYRQSNRIKEIRTILREGKNYKSADKDSIILYYAKALQANGKYDEAKSALEDLISSTANEKIRDRAQKEIKGFDYLNVIGQKKDYYRVKSLDALNTPFAGIWPGLFQRAALLCILPNK